MVRKLAQLIQLRYDWYVAISKGGLVPACLLGRLTSVNKIDTFCATAYKEKKFDKVELIYKNYSHLRDQKVLLIDDLVDSGATMQAVFDHLSLAWRPKLIHTAVLFKKSGSKFIPDYFAAECEKDRWIEFPWEDDRLLGSFNGK